MSYAATATWWFEGGKHYTKQGFLEHAKDFAPGAPPSLRGRHIAITGANAGLGYALAKQLAAQEAVVHMLCRNRQSKGIFLQTKLLTEETICKKPHVKTSFCSLNIRERTYLIFILRDKSGQFQGLIPPIDTPRGTHGIFDLVVCHF